MDVSTAKGVADHGNGKPSVKEKLHIFVNRKKFEVEDGVKPTMTGREIAALVEIRAEDAIIRKGNTLNSPTIEPDEKVEIHMADHFMVTRKAVDGGASNES